MYNLEEIITSISNQLGPICNHIHIGDIQIEIASEEVIMHTHEAVVYTIYTPLIKISHTNLWKINL